MSERINGSGIGSDGKIFSDQTKSIMTKKWTGMLTCFAVFFPTLTMNCAKYNKSTYVEFDRLNMDVFSFTLNYISSLCVM